ncbi:MAG: hypothetical protein ACR2FE_03050 [Aeromicrobium sp.]
MPSTTVNHESWCQQRETTAGDEYCQTAALRFGEHGTVTAVQGESEARPTIWISNGTDNLDEVAVEDLLPLRRALDEVLSVFGAEVIA